MISSKRQQDGQRPIEPAPSGPHGWQVPSTSRNILLLGLLVTSGCYAPLHSCGIPASALPDSYRIRSRSMGEPLNYASLTLPAQTEYLLGPSDVLEVIIHELYPGNNRPIRPIRTQVMGTGDIHLPLVGAVRVAGMNLLQAHSAITKAYADGYIKEPRTNVYLVEPATVSILVLGEVESPGVYHLPKYENDVAHALAQAGGIGNDAGSLIEVHRRVSPEQVDTEALRKQIRSEEPGVLFELPPTDDENVVPEEDTSNHVLRIPLRGLPPQSLTTADITLQTGDVVVVPSRINEVFFVVGKLNTTNLVRFSSGLEVRDLGVGFLLPRDRDVDVVTAVAMAGYIDPIDSPTTITVQRTLPNGEPLLIHVDLFKARYDSQETVMVQAGDILYLNPDFPWWFRRTFDRVIPGFILLPYESLVMKIFAQGN